MVNYDDYTYALVTAACCSGLDGGRFLLRMDFISRAVARTRGLCRHCELPVPGEWVDAILISLIAWLAAVIGLSVLPFLGITSFEATGVPGA